MDILTSSKIKIWYKKIDWTMMHIPKLSYNLNISSSPSWLKFMRTAPQPKPLKPSVPHSSDVNASLGNIVKPQLADSNITFRSALQEKQVKSCTESGQYMASADDLIPPYDFCWLRKMSWERTWCWCRWMIK